MFARDGPEIPYRGVLLALGVLLLLASGSAFAEEESKSSEYVTPCNFRTCNDCILSQKCVWCSEVVEQSDVKSFQEKKRCVALEYANRTGSDWCPMDMIVGRLQDDSKTVKQDEPNAGFEVKRISLSLHPGESRTFSLKYKPKSNVPIDVYFLTDLTFTMSRVRDKLSELGYSVAELMQKVTTDFRIGFGSFIDKVVLPMTSTTPSKQKRDCRPEHSKTFQACSPPYSFKNQMPLSKEVGDFKDRVSKAPISGNIDGPEGGFDALMQVFVCTEQIGWRDDARRIIVFTTNSPYHIAGDGKLAGIVEPNDEKCHTNSSGFYDHAELLDYPSIGQINRMAQEKNMNIIFAVSNRMVDMYTALSERINKSVVAAFEDKFVVIESTIQTLARDISGKVSMVHNANEKLVSVAISSDCQGNTNTCKKVGTSPIDFKVDIKASKCPDDPKEWNQMFWIKADGMDEKVAVELNLICGCPCARTDHVSFEVNSNRCNGNGNFTCGVCQCDGNYVENDCRCKSGEDDVVGVSSTEGCTEEGSDEVCHGRGTCKCGKCTCIDSQFSGKHCEYDSRSCDHKGKTCGGHGRCVRNECSCDQGYSGENCECDLGTSNCRADDNSTELCSGHGNCECNECKCESNIFYGDHCEQCWYCKNEHCHLYDKCLRCYVRELNGTEIPPHSICTNECASHYEVLIQKDEINEEQKLNKNQLCNFTDDEGCTRSFIMKNNPKSDVGIVRLNLRTTKTCPEPVNVIPIAIGVVVGTLLLGLLIILAYKLMTSIYDAREFAKFEKERAAVAWGRNDNPLYKPVTTTFSNPSYDQD